MEERTLPTTRAGFTTYFQDRPRARVVLEVGTHSPWIARLLTALNQEVIVANPSAMYGQRRRRRRNDRSDAEFLARQGRADVSLLHGIQHRGADAQAHLGVLRARDHAVRVRTQLINHVRGSVKSVGERLSGCATEAFVRRVTAEIPPTLQAALAPLLATISGLNDTIHQYDAQLEHAIKTTYPVAKRLQEPQGVGPLTALAFVWLVDDPHRFAQSRAVGAYFGLVPRLDASGDVTPQLRITKAGDPLGRRLLVNAAHYILGPFGPPSDLRHHGEALMLRGGKNAKKRAVVAVARRLAVLLHHLWIHDVPYVAEHAASRRAA